MFIALKVKHPASKISVRFPAKLVRDGRVIRDMFPDWHAILRRDRLDQQGYNMGDRAGKYDRVFEPSDVSLVDASDTDYDVNDHVDDDQRPSFSGSMATGTTVPYSHGLPKQKHAASNEADHGGASDTASGISHNGTNA